MSAMRKVVTILAFTSVAFAGSTAYLAWQLSQERARHVAPVLTVDAPRMAPQSPGLGTAPSAPGTTTQGGAMPALEVADPAAWAGSPEFAREQQIEFARHYLAQLSSPEHRAALIDQNRALFRQIYPRLDLALNLSREEYARLLDALAEQQVGMQERSFRCLADPACDPNSPENHQLDQAEPQIAELIGPERAAQFERYKNTMGEREAVTQMRMRLADAHRLTDASAEKLITMLAEEREAVYRDLAQRQSGATSHGIGVGMVFMDSAAGSPEQQYESARQNSQRLRDRVRPHLDDEQMRVFDEMQEETLASLRTQLRSKDETRDTFFVAPSAGAGN